ncbi:MAG: nitroreductase [Phycisphaerae bacterium SM23_30]|nr:MAG: nitroreductase [Phycisphaerae bacterium SM23_30]
MLKRYMPYRWQRFPEEEMERRGREYFKLMNARRSVRAFSGQPVGRELIELAIRTASTAPSGAHRQPWRFVAVSDPEVKRRLREAAEREEYEFYEGPGRNEQWLAALERLGTNRHKEFLEAAPWLVVVFEQRYGINADGSKRQNYYVSKSVGIACGMFIAAVHQMGLATLPYTPAAMGFLSEILGGAKNERSYIVFPVGYPAEGVEVPDLIRKGIDEICEWKIAGE